MGKLQIIEKELQQMRPMKVGNPIKRGTQHVPHGIWYTTFSKFLHAKAIDDLDSPSRSALF